MVKSIPKPTGRELEIMQVLWKCGPCTVRDVLDAINESREEPLAYTTILRFFQIMHEKGLVDRDTRDRTHIYHPAVPAQQTKRILARDLLDRVFSGSPRELVLHLLGQEKSSVQDLAEIREALRELEEENSDDD